MANFFGSGFRIEPEAQSVVEHDYWEEFTRVNSAFSHEPDIAIKKIKKSKDAKPENESGKLPSEKTESNGNIKTKLKSMLYPRLSKDHKKENKDEESTGIEDADNTSDLSLSSTEVSNPGHRSIGIQTEGNYDLEPELPYWFCFCCRSSTPCVVWMFIGISIIFFKMGAIVTGRWIYLSQSSFDEVVFYIAFSICLGFSTLYFRRGTKYRNPFDLMFLVLTVPIMWALLTFTTFLLKKDTFFYVGSGIYSAFIIPYTAMGSYIIYKFWKMGKFFKYRVEGNTALLGACKKLFFTQSLIVFDTQLTICACVISMAPSVNHENKIVWISSLVAAPVGIFTAAVAMIIGYLAIRKENMILTWVFTVLSANQFIMVIGMLIKRPTAPGAYSVFINVAMVFCCTLLLIIHIGLLIMLWNWIVPAFGTGLKGPVNRTSKNNCIQCAKLTICR